MDEDAREALRGQLDELDKAAEEIETAMKPFRLALNAVEGVREALLERHDAEIAGKCEGCLDPIFSGDKAYTDGSGEVTFCERCAPTWGDLRKETLEMPDDAWDEPDGRQRCLDMIEAHVAGGGSLDEKHVWEH